MNHSYPTLLSVLLLLSCTPKNDDSGLVISNSPSCLTNSTPTDSFELFPDLPSTQIHADIAFDGHLIWTVFNLPNSESDFDVYLGAIHCNGKTSIEPQQILNIPGHNQTTPRIAISNDNILIAAQSDNGSSANNLSIHLYVQHRDGTAISEREWTPIIDSTEIGNRWLPSISGDRDGFWLAAAAANGTHFQTAVQRLNSDGEDVGSPFWVGPNTYAVFPNIDGTPTEFVAAWESGDDSVQWVKGSVNGGDADYIEQSNSSSPNVLWNDGNPIVFANRRAPLAVTMNDAQLSLLGNSHFPNAAVGSTHTFIGYFKIQSGYANDVYISTLLDENIVEQDILIENNSPAAPYRPAVTNVGEDSFLMVWSGGQNPSFMLTGQFIDLTAAE